MSVYMTEAEQLERIKKWWQQYNGIITVSLSILLLVIAGFKYWNWHQEKVTQQASNAYEHLMLAFSNQDNKSVRGYASELINNYGSTVYADAARLTLAKLYVAREKYPRAQEALSYVATHSKMVALADVAKIRLARLYSSDKSYDKAIAELATIQDVVYMPVVNELRGDIYAAKGQYSQAIAYYRKAIQQIQTNGMGNLFLEMKTNDLAAFTQSKKAEKVELQTA
jgi:predicted negative regulator of RcsB-dependent stress response